MGAELAEALFELLVRPLGYALLVGLMLAPLERLWPLRASGSRDGASLRIDVGYAIVGAGLAQLGITWLAGSALDAVASWREGLPSLGSLPIVARLALGLVVFELGGYAYHRLAHAWAPLWRLHRVHHSASTLDWLASFRQHPLEIVLMTGAQNLPLVLLGISLGEHALVVLALRVWTALVHANLRLPRALEWVIATPRLHHRHHDRDAPTANYASLLPWIDRVLGTFDDADARALGLGTDEGRR